MGSSHHPATTTADRQRLSEPHEAREPAVRSHPNGRPDGEATRQDNTTATADTSTGSTRKEHGASYPRPLPRSLCGVRCLLQRTAREGSDVDAGRCGTERREAPGHARSPLVLRRQETPVRYCTHVADCIRMLVHLVAGKPSLLRSANLGDPAAGFPSDETGAMATSARQHRHRGRGKSALPTRPAPWPCPVPRPPYPAGQGRQAAR